VALALVMGLAMPAAVEAQGAPGQMPPGGPRGMGPGGPGAQGGPGMGGPGGGLRAVMQLDLTDQQRTEIRQIMQEQRQAGRELQAQVRQTQQQLMTAIYGGSQEAGSALEIVTRLAELQKQVLEADVTVQQRVAQLLTDEQKQQLLKMLNRAGPPPPPAQ
jgi:Spy/CpxP family protein refolding chaperone